MCTIYLVRHIYNILDKIVFLFKIGGVGWNIKHIPHILNISWRISCSVKSAYDVGINVYVYACIYFTRRFLAINKDLMFRFLGLETRYIIIRKVTIIKPIPINHVLRCFMMTKYAFYNNLVPKALLLDIIFLLWNWETRHHFANGKWKTNLHKIFPNGTLKCWLWVS